VPEDIIEALRYHELAIASSNSSAQKDVDRCQQLLRSTSNGALRIVQFELMVEQARLGRGSSAITRLVENPDPGELIVLKAFDVDLDDSNALELFRRGSAIYQPKPSLQGEDWLFLTVVTVSGAYWDRVCPEWVAAEGALGQRQIFWMTWGCASDQRYCSGDAVHPLAKYCASGLEAIQHSQPRA
jgi:hypothetical protein